MQVLPVILGCDFSGFNDCRDFNAAPLFRFGLPPISALFRRFPPAPLAIFLRETQLF